MKRTMNVVLKKSTLSSQSPTPEAMICSCDSFRICFHVTRQHAFRAIFFLNFGKWGLNSVSNPPPSFLPTILTVSLYHPFHSINSTFIIMAKYIIVEPYNVLWFSFPTTYHFPKSWYLACFIMCLVYYILTDNSIPQANWLSLPSIHCHEKESDNNIFSEILSLLYPHTLLAAGEFRILDWNHFPSEMKIFLHCLLASSVSDLVSFFWKSVVSSCPQDSETFQSYTPVSASLGIAWAHSIWKSIHQSWVFLWWFLPPVFFILLCWNVMQILALLDW